MKQTHTYRDKIRQFISILLPILITQISLFLMLFFDTVMSGQASPSDLAGVAIGSSIWTPVNTGLTGILIAITPIVAQLIGAKREDKVAHVVFQGMYVGLVIAVVVLICGYFALNPILEVMKLEDEVHRIAHDFLVALSIGIVPLFIYTVLRSFIDALGRTRVTMVITLCSLPINVVLNYMWIYGKGGFPKLGGVGAGYASAVTHWLILIIFLLVVNRNKAFKKFQIFAKWYKPHWQTWKEQLKLGVPIGFSIFFETSVFAGVTILMSQFNTNTIAAHQAALNFASLLYMVPLSIAMALTITIGFEVGALRKKDATQYSIIGIISAVMMSVFCGVLLFFLNNEIAGLYSQDKTVIELTKVFLYYALFFQLFDAIAAPIQGALRGYKDVNITLIATLVAYWIVGLPLGYVLANFTSLEAYGYWIGLISGIGTGAIILSVRLIKMQRNNSNQSHPTVTKSV
ncbi:MATE family efflux transporter [Paenibacillus sp. N1-5-1-14]|uniref:MATE family efflux transporter n=1 Tax=Paenibacillus radicibacter TaxID=2972488 RepID=UPI002159888C|nr:MATE family efflux transporter [Paenibacillus radicibacter]MCR8645353.1 MATE family efflux transporter [Paenibacillus radicibacter]